MANKPTDHPHFATRVTSLGRSAVTERTTVNHPIHRASTILFSSVAEFERSYGMRYDDIIIFTVVWARLPGRRCARLALTSRGLRTLALRLDRHYQTGLRLAEHLRGRPGVRRVMHPALPDDPGHALWQRDFDGASALFAIILEPRPPAALRMMVDQLCHFTASPATIARPEFLPFPVYRWRVCGYTPLSLIFDKFYKGFPRFFLDGSRWGSLVFKQAGAKWPKRQ